MAKIVRYDGEVKAFGIDATTTERTVFGSPSASPVTSNTLNDNLNADFMRGWGILAPGAKPPKQYFNGALFTATQFIAYLHQMGIPEWNGAQEYHIGSASIFSGKVYFCKTNTHKSITDPSTDTVNWSKGLDVTDIVNNLTSTDATKALSAAQGKVLQDSTVKLSGDQTVAGIKTFSSSPVVPDATLPGQPVSLGQFTQSLAPSGWQKLPSGLIIQWGVANVGSGVPVLVTLPVAFPNVFLRAIGAGSDNGINNAYPCNASVSSLTQVRLAQSTGITINATWFAIGY